MQVNWQYYKFAQSYQESMDKELSSKYQKEAYFRKQTDGKSERYQSLLQAGNYTDISMIPQDLLSKVKDKEIYVYLGFKQPTAQKLIHKLAVYFVKNFHPTPNKPYTFIFFNQNCPDNYVLWNFRELFSSLPIAYLECLSNMIVVKPYFYHKAMDWMTFGVVAKYVKSKTVFCYSIKQLCQRTRIQPQMLINLIPSTFYSTQYPNIAPPEVSISRIRYNISGQQRCQQQMLEMQQFHKTIKSMILKPGNEINQISDYELSDIGVPVILKMLVFYFKTNENYMKEQGLFRKSVSIDEETETIKNIMEQNYDYLLEIKNPHIIANLIKRFFSSLKVPIIPYKIFYKLMQNSAKTQIEHLKEAIDLLPELNKRVLVFLMNFLNDSIISHSSENKMDDKNLAICFGPCLLRQEKVSEASIMYAAKAPKFTKLMITNTQQIFGCKDEQDELFRKSYNQSHIQFSKILEIPIEQAMRSTDNLEQEKTNRCSHTINDYDGQKLVEGFIEQANQEPKEEEQPQNKNDAFDKMLLGFDEPTQTINPRFSRQMQSTQQLDLVQMQEKGIKQSKIQSMHSDSEDKADNKQQEKQQANNKKYNSTIGFDDDDEDNQKVEQ